MTLVNALNNALIVFNSRLVSRKRDSGKPDYFSLGGRVSNRICYQRPVSRPEKKFRFEQYGKYHTCDITVHNLFKTT